MYLHLKTKKINNISYQNIDEDMIVEILDECYKKCAFSIFPYLLNINSKKAIEIFKSGDCVALSIFIKNKLKNKNIQSFLIPATIPNKYKLDGLLDISHVALCIPTSATTFYIADPAFYFLNPIIVDTVSRHNDNNHIVYSKNIYKNEENHLLTDYQTIDHIKYTLEKLDNDKIFNKYQTIPSDTYYVTAYYDNDKLDTWNYFIIEIMNPDEAVTTFFINIKKTPFITSTVPDNNGILTLDNYLVIEDDYIKLKQGKNTEIFNKQDLTLDNLSLINSKLSKFLNNTDFSYFKNMKFGNITIKD